MARDVDFNVTASDKTGMALAQAERHFRESGEKISRQQQKENDKRTKGLIEAAKKATPGIVGSLETAFSAGGKAGGPAIAAALAASAPVIGGVLSAAIIGGVGVGGVIGGVALAARDQRVQMAGRELGETLMQGLERSAAGFVTPVLEAIDTIEDRFSGIEPVLKGIFDDASRFLAPLVDGVLDFTDGLLGGLKAVTAEGGPVIDALADGLGDLGDSLGTMLKTIAGGSEDAALSLRAFLAFVNGTIVATGYLVRGLTELAGVILYIPDKINGLRKSLQGVDEESRKVGSGTFGVAQQMQTGTAIMGRYGDEIATTGEALLTLDQRMQQVYGTTRSLFDAQTQAADAIAGVSEAVKQNGKTLDINTEKGRANRNVLSNLAGTLNNAYAAYVKVNGEGRAANGVAASNYASFVKAARGMGLSQKAAETYARKLGLIPPKKATDFTANTHDAEARVRALQQSINNVQGKTVYITAITRERKQAALDRSDGRRAAGGPVEAGRTYLVGERGPELIQMAGAGKVIPNDQIGGGFTGDLYVQVDLGAGVRQVIRIENRDLKRRANMRGAA